VTFQASPEHEDFLSVTYFTSVMIGDTTAPLDVIRAPFSIMRAVNLSLNCDNEMGQEKRMVDSGCKVVTSLILRKLISKIREN
jgi:hypothetical protein